MSDYRAMVLESERAEKSQGRKRYVRRVPTYGIHIARCTNFSAQAHRALGKQQATVENHFHAKSLTASKMDLSAASAAGAGAVPSADAGPAAMSVAIDAALSNLKPLRDLAQNWDINIASW